jgi:hypothetical protein
VTRRVAPVFAGNVLTGSTPANYSGYPGNFFPATDAEVGFVDLSHGNYCLGPASAYKNATTDGKDPGGGDRRARGGDGGSSLRRLDSR